MSHATVTLTQRWPLRSGEEKAIVGRGDNLNIPGKHLSHISACLRFSLSVCTSDYFEQEDVFCKFFIINLFNYLYFLFSRAPIE